MCCIIYKPKNVPMPSRGILGKIMRLNHNGYGFVSTNHYYRGLDYRTFLHKLSYVGSDEDCIIHFRLATHGSVCCANCHPFCENGVYFAHNGILNINPLGDMTDSETVFKTYIYPAIARYGYNSREVDCIIHSVIGCSRFALYYRGDVRLYGHYECLNGVYYSNIRWLCI